DGPTAELIQRRLTEPPPQPRRHNRGIPRELDEVVVRALARSAADRYATAAGFLAALAALPQPGAGGRRFTGLRSLLGSRRRTAETAPAATSTPVTPRPAAPGAGVAGTPSPVPGIPAPPATRTPTPAPGPAAAPPARRRTLWPPAAAVLLGLLATGVLAWVAGRDRPGLAIDSPAPGPAQTPADSAARPDTAAPVAAARDTAAAVPER